ncbi:MAG: tRNA adenosine(34) deaminase TadA [Planctomycetes bacterium]|nr:tRNA adenosine(34) deaminase TadA [Planctomycetota bacterium]
MLSFVTNQGGVREMFDPDIQNALQNEDDLKFMQIALRQAAEAYDENEVPVGCVIVKDGKLIAKAHNQVETLKDPTAHAEILAITQASAAIEHKWLLGATLYTTLEPCSMCAGALILARVARVVFGAFDPKTGACGSVFDVIGGGKLNHQIGISKGVLEEECAFLLSDFFQKKREIT